MIKYKIILTARACVGDLVMRKGCRLVGSFSRQEVMSRICHGESVTLTSTQLVHQPTTTRIQNSFLNNLGLRFVLYIRCYMNIFVSYGAIYATQEFFFN